MKLVKVILNQPYPDLRYGARSHALLLGNLEFPASNKEVVINTFTDKSFNKNNYYNSIIGSNHLSNKQVVYNFRIIGSKIFRELLKSIPDVYVESGTEFDEMSSEFSVDGDLNRSCEFNLSINLYMLMQLLKYLQDNVKLFYNVYGAEMIGCIDNAIKLQIRVPNVFSKLYEKASSILTYEDIKLGMDLQNTSSLGEISTFNKSNNIKLIGLLEYIENLKDLESHSFSDIDRIPYVIKELRVNGLIAELKDLCCNISNLNDYQLELLNSYVENLSEEHIVTLFKCKLNKSDCICKEKQFIKQIETNESPCIILTKLNQYETKTKLNEKLTKIITKIIEGK